MDERIKKLTTPDKCETFASNARKKGREDLAKEALLRSVELRAEQHGAGAQPEKEALQAVYAYEETLHYKNGKRTRATRTWQMIQRHGIIESVNRAVCRPTETQGYRALAELGLTDLAFEAVVLRHPDTFSSEAVKISEERLKQWKNDNH